MIHGLSGTPATMKPVIDELVKAGFLVNAPLLPGHGTVDADLRNVRWQEWWDAVKTAYFSLKMEAKKISCVGLSLGSLLALKLAIEMRWGIRAVVAMGTPLVLSPMIEYFAYPAVKYTPVRFFYKYSQKDWEKSVAEPEGLNYYKRHSYSKIAVNSVMELFKLKKLVRSRMGEITSPLLAIHGKEDDVAPLKNIKILKESINSNMIDVILLDRSRHVVSLDFDKEVAAKASVAFLERFS